MKNPLDRAFSDTAKELLVSEPFYSHLLGYMNHFGLTSLGDKAAEAMPSILVVCTSMA
jgi:hypothetical protein